jgi:predicted nucleic acid-binding protein
LTGRVLLDTGPIVAILSHSDPYHKTCLEAPTQIEGRLMTCWPVITEAAWLLRKYPQAIDTLLGSYNGQPFELLALTEFDLAGITAILDRRDFGALGLARGKKLRLIP